MTAYRLDLPALFFLLVFLAAAFTLFLPATPFALFFAAAFFVARDRVSLAARLRVALLASAAAAFPAAFGAERRSCADGPVA
jgi:hypothetical protein